MWKRFAFILILLFGASCVYYNGFFNAQKGFSQAEKSQLVSKENRDTSNVNLNSRAGKPIEPIVSTNDKTLYKAAIDKANNVILYEKKESKYYDDALWLVGKARFNMTEYVAADKKFHELIELTPNSEFIDDAYYYMGMSQFWLNNYDGAFEAFQNVLSLKKSQYKDDAAFNIGYIQYLQGSFSSSITSFEDLLKDYSKSDSAAAAQYFIAVDYDSLNNIASALAAYSKVNEYNPDHELYFDTYYAYGSAALRADSVDLGMRIFDRLAKDERYFNKSSLIRLKLAEGKQLSGNTDEAISEYLKVAEQFPKTEQATEAYYRLGIVYQDVLFDLEKAKENYNKASQENKDSEFRNFALARSAQISKLETYKTHLEGSKQKDKSAADSVTTDSLTVDSTAVADSIIVKGDSVKADTVAIKTDSSITDSTAIIDSAIAINDSIKTDTAAVPADSMTIPPPNDKPSSPDDTMPPVFEQMLGAVGDRPGMTPPDGGKNPPPPDSLPPGMDNKPSPRDRDKKDKPKEPKPQAPDSSAIDSLALSGDDEVRYLLAELYHHELNRPDSALHEYLLLVETFPESPYAPKAELAAAYIYEQKGDTASALQTYKTLIEKYPSSSQAKFASTKITDASIPGNLDVELLYDQGEEQYFTYNNPDSAIVIFKYIENTFPQSEYAAQSAYARAWIISQTTRVDGDSTAYHAYSDIVTKYADTPYAQNAKILMGLEKKIEPESKKPKPQPAKGSPSDTLSQSQLDSLANLLPAAPPVKDSITFIYPETLLNEGHREKGTIYFKIKMDLFGNITDHQLLGTSGNEIIDSVATATLLKTTFDTSKIDDLSTLSGYFRYEIRFEPPENWEDRYEHSDPDDPYDDE